LRIGGGAVCSGGTQERRKKKHLQSAWPLRRSAGWLEHVNSPQTDAEFTALRRSAASIDTTIAAHRSGTKPGQPPQRRNWGRKLPTALTEDPEFKTTVPDTLSAFTDRIQKHSVNLLLPVCVSNGSPLANASSENQQFGVSLPCVSYGQVSSANA